ncbi:squalene/phytoene synthase family protein [Tabrizicola sp.]|uniref:phytoene/squalene synthase family protein n=1 Tax=Tabrizicola sp. TaxID=2005166 RepID=UPI001A4E5C21|nr:squalene/phytoene synthase family protein [Tabrizicola sp.]MBL9074579.1 squalene/phytoene synthase family protein [Tabrizicola sp.]
MSVAACAALVERGDPDRFRAVMAAPVEARAQLFPLYAFNLEVARAPWVTQEPLIAEMRLQWWREVVENAASGAARAHEVAGPLHELIRDFGLPVEVLDRLIAARRWDIARDPHEGAEGLADYLEDTGAGLMWLAARALGAPDAAEAAVRAYGWASSAAMYIRAVPELAARGRQPLPASISAQDLATRGLDKLAEARAGRKSVPKDVAPALLAGWQTEALLRQVVAGRSSPELSEARKRWGLMWQAVTGRW